MRALFVLLPAIVIGLLASIVATGLGLLLFVSVAWLGIQLTTPHPERGEGLAAHPKEPAHDR